MKVKIIIGVIAFILVGSGCVYLFVHDNTEKTTNTTPKDANGVAMSYRSDVAPAIYVDEVNDAIPGNAISVFISKWIDPITFTSGDEVYRLAGVKLYDSSGSESVNENIMVKAQKFIDGYVDKKAVYVVGANDNKDNEGRILVYVWTSNSFVNLQLLRQGLIVIDDKTLDDNYKNIFNATEEYAKQDNNGIWAY
jgi:endonuclease YncB( thermonuclease family)